MKIIRKSLILALMLIGLWAPSSMAQESVDGAWAGGSNLFGRPIFIQARFERTATGFNGVFSAQEWNAAKRAMTNISVESSQLHFEFPSSTLTPFVGDGHLKDGVIRGSLRRGDEQGSFHLVRVARVNPKVYDDYVGAYEISSWGKNLVTWGAFGHLRVINLSAVLGEALLPLSETTFFMGRSVINSTTPDEIVTFVRSKEGRVTGLTVRLKTNPEVSGQKVETYRQEQVKFSNGAITLAGTLLTPPVTNLRHSAVILVHGSQDRSRDDSYDFSFADTYLRLGIAALIFDKRGVGGSTGDWRHASFEDLAEDVLAGVRFLKARHDINPKQIGLRGISQGGWVAPIVAARSKDVAFLVTISAAGVSPAEQVTHDQLRKAREAGASEDELKEAAAFLRLQYEATRSRDERERFQAAIPEARSKSWFRVTLGGVPKESWLWDHQRLTAHFDPVPVLRKIKCPALLVFGELDQNYPAQKSAAIMERALREGGNKDVTIKIFPKANHSLQVRQADGKVLGAPLGEVEAEWAIKRINVNF